jgi:hypothetical protein
LRETIFPCAEKQKKEKSYVNGARCRAGAVARLSVALRWCFFTFGILVVSYCRVGRGVWRKVNARIQWMSLVCVDWTRVNHEF